MVIQNVMFVALGVLAAALVAIAIVPAIVRRAVRLTRRRIEAATPMTLNEFRADKDKLRAEFAIASRRAELQREALRDKIAASATDLDAVRVALNETRTERDAQAKDIEALNEQLEEHQQRIGALQTENAELAERLSAAERAYPEGSIGAELDTGLDLETQFDPESLTGDYDRDVEELLTALGLERQRAELFRDQNRTLVKRLDSATMAKQARRAAPSDATTNPLRPDNDDNGPADATARMVNGLDLAQARIESAGNDLSALLDRENESAPEEGEAEAARHVVTIEADVPEAQEHADMAAASQARLEAVRARVAEIETRVRADYKTKTFDPALLRTELDTIASDISTIVYESDADPNDAEGEDQSLFQKISKFAPDEAEGEDETPESAEADSAAPETAKPKRGGTVSDRMRALRDLQIR